MKYEYENHIFEGILMKDKTTIDILVDGNHLIYCDLDQYEEFGNVSANELFKIVMEDLLDDDKEKLYEEIYFQNIRFEK